MWNYTGELLTEAAKEPLGSRGISAHSRGKGVEVVSVLLIFLALVLGIGFLMAAELLRLSHSVPQCLDPDMLKKELSTTDKYQPLTRLFSRADFKFLAARNDFLPERHRQLYRSRRRVMSLYLGEMRHDFHRTWSLCRLLAPFSKDPEFGTNLVRQLVVFYGLYISVRLRLLVGSYGYAGADIEQLVNVLRGMRLGAQEAFQTAEALSFQAAAA